MDGQLDTCDGSSGRPGALLEIFFFYTNSTTPLTNLYTLFFVIGEDDIARFDSWRYTYTDLDLSIHAKKDPKNLVTHSL